MKRNYFLAVIILGSMVSGCSIPFKTHPNEPTKLSMQQTKKFEDREQIQLVINDQKIKVEVVNTEQSTAQGLSGRESIGADGMLFIFPNTQVRQFWMKEMLFPIDIIWIRQQKIVGITENAPIPSPQTQLSNLPKYPSPEAVEMVLEVPAGYTELHQISVGMTVSLD